MGIIKRLLSIFTRGDRTRSTASTTTTSHRSGGLLSRLRRLLG